MSLVLAVLLPGLALAAPNSRDYVYDLAGRLSKAMDAEGNLVSYGYDAVGNIVKISRDKVDPTSNILGALPLTGGAGDLVTVQGNGFDTNVVGNTVTIGGVAATVVSVDAKGRKLVVKVPWGAESGPIEVSANGKSLTAPEDFTVIQYGDVGIRGTLAPGGTTSYPIELQAGQSVQIRLTDNRHDSFYPTLALQDPNGKRVDSGGGYEVAAMGYAALASGTYQIVVSDGSGGKVDGDYTLYYSVAPGSHEGGALPLNTAVDGVIDQGDLDSYTFEVSAGVGIWLNVADVGATALYPYLRVYDPNGKLVEQAGAYDVAAVGFAATLSGRYTVVLADGNSGYAGTGAYKLYYMQAPGSNEGGALDATTPIDGNIELGDIDSYTFDVSAGVGVRLSVADVGGTSLYPYLFVYDPNGKRVESVGAYDVTSLGFAATLSGKYTAVVLDGNASHAGVGAYKLYYTQAPGSNEGGALDPANPIDGEIELGDLDSYTFDVTAGVGIRLSVADVGGTSLYPYLIVYDPNGKAVDSVGAYDVASLGFAPTLSGKYTVVVLDANANHAGVGAYKLYYTQAPGSNEGGALDPTNPIDGSIELGDLDSYTLDVTAGVGIRLSVADVGGTSLYPYLIVYDPNGKAVDSVGAYDVASLGFVPALSGKYTVVVLDANANHAGVGAYKLYYTQAPGSNEGGALDPTNPIDGSIELGDLDSYTVNVTAGVGIRLSVADVGATALYPYIFLYDPNGKLVDQAGGYDVAAIGYSPLLSGKYTAVVLDANANHAGVGAYKLYYTQAPGSNEGGALDPTNPIDGSITLGDLDSYTFDATAGSGIQLRVADMGASALYPYVLVYDPNGKLVEQAGGNDVASARFSPLLSGKYTAVVLDASTGYTGTGSYKLYFVNAPGANEGGALTLGTPVAGTIDLGDMDSFTLTATAGTKLKVVATDVNTSALVPYIAVYGPTGVNVVNASNATTATAAFTATVAGTYTIVILDNGSASGDYSLVASLN